jgi:23S rRNA pseudouridine955/2504/2580 synthase
MRTVMISEKHAGKRIDRVLIDIFPHAPVSAVYKALRKKDIKANGVRIRDNYIVHAGDVLDIYISNDILNGVPLEDSSKMNKGFTIVYEDKNILIVNKQQGVLVHPDREQINGTLIEFVQNYLAQKGEYLPGALRSFPPALCHRLDRNTGGLIIVAKNRDSLKIMLAKIKNKEIKKYYQCLVKGKMQREQAELRAFLTKDEKKSRVFISGKKTKDSLEIITKYRVLSYKNDISRLEIELVTGRTHQIRAHMAYIGHPIIGDGKYGTNAINRPLRAKSQALWAYKIKFDFKNDAGRGNYLKGKQFEIKPEFDI